MSDIQFGSQNSLEGRSLRGGGGNDDGVLHGVVLFKGLDELGDGGSLLTNGNVDTVKLLLLVGSLVPSLPNLHVSVSFLQVVGRVAYWLSMASRATAVFPV